MSRSPLLIGASSERERATRIAGLRMAVGATLMIPALGRRLFGVPANQDNGSLRLVARLFGVRNVVLGAWTLAARDQGVDERRLCYRLNAVVDAVDVLALLWGAISAEGLLQASAMGCALGTAALLAWMDLLAEAGSVPSLGSVSLS